MSQKSVLSFLAIQGLPLPTVGILDIGAMLLEGQRKEYAPLLQAGRARVVGFEPVAAECERLNREMAGAGLRWLPYFIGDGRRQVFCENNWPMTSSLYEADVELLGLYQNLLELTTTVSRAEVQTTRLDDITEIDFPVDYVKIDIQGAELQAFAHGRRVLSATTVIQTEVEWLPMYQGQPLFSEIELELRAQGFVLHRILGFGSRAMKPFTFNNQLNAGPQHLWSDVVFVRDFRRLDALDDAQLLAYAVVIGDLYGAVDLACHVLREYGRRHARDLGMEFHAWLLRRN